MSTWMMSGRRARAHGGTTSWSETDSGGAKTVQGADHEADMLVEVLASSSAPRYTSWRIHCAGEALSLSFFLTSQVSSPAMARPGRTSRQGK